MRHLVHTVFLVLAITATGCQQPQERIAQHRKPVFPKPHVVRRPAPRPANPMTPIMIPSTPLPRPVQPVISEWPIADSTWTPSQGIQSRWTDIVVHHSASDRGGASVFDRHHRKVKGWDELGYHFVIGNGTDTGDGQVEVGPRWQKQKTGAHCKTAGNHYNEHGVGICLVGNFDAYPPSSAQLASLNRLLVFLADSCQISVDRVNTHGGITHKTQCPGRHFPLTDVRQRIRQTQPQARYAQVAPR